MLIKIIQAGFVSSLVWFIVGGILYMNPFVSGIYKKHKDSPGFREWKDTKKYLMSMYILGTLIQCLFFAFVYAFIRPALPTNLITRTVAFALILVVVKIYPRFSDMWLQSTYPFQLLLVEIVNGTIGSFLISFVLSLMI